MCQRQQLEHQRQEDWLNYMMESFFDQDIRLEFITYRKVMFLFLLTSKVSSESIGLAFASAVNATQCTATVT
jgi:hypothetical protein